MYTYYIQKALYNMLFRFNNRLPATSLQQMTRAEFQDWWLNTHKPLALQLPKIRKYAINIVNVRCSDVQMFCSYLMDYTFSRTIPYSFFALNTVFHHHLQLLLRLTRSRLPFILLLLLYIPLLRRATDIIVPAVRRVCSVGGGGRGHDV